MGESHSCQAVFVFMGTVVGIDRDLLVLQGYWFVKTFNSFTLMNVFRFYQF